MPQFCPAWPILHVRAAYVENPSKHVDREPTNDLHKPSCVSLDCLLLAKSVTNDRFTVPVMFHVTIVVSFV